MNVLFVVPYVPNLVRARSYNLIRHLAARGHAVSVVAIRTGDHEQADVENLRRLCAVVETVHLPAWRSLVNCVGALPGGEPLQGVYSWSPALRACLDRLLPVADVVHVEHLRGARYALHAKQVLAGSPVPVVWDSVDCISYLFEQAATRRHDRVGRLVSQLELSRTRRREAWLWRQFDRVLISSDVDRSAIMALGRERSVGPVSGHEAPVRDADDRRVTVIPNGVDTAYFTPADQPRRPNTLVFSGKMSYHANVSAVAHLVGDIMPLVWARVPDARLTIVGKDPAPFVKDLASRHPEHVTVTGTVPDIRPYLRQASAAVIPLVYGAGSQFKVLEAMACGTPVVASPKAVAVLETRPGRDVLVGGSAQAFADAVAELLADAARQREIGIAARAYVEAHHSWDRIAGQLEGVYREAIAARHAQNCPGGELRTA